ncbi:MAG: disulfide reductase [Desulfobacteraceae bacterium]|nr:CoB--CoM heterodisulfide reductase iron-sulfur subunit B family protein [Desulfobacteraceae bacterium]MBC2757842.1 disulfide reductase [Desulfobacteraceae bacterium]
MKYGFFPGCSYKGAAGYKESTEAVSRLLGIELVEIQDWNCCGATSYWSTQSIEAYVLPARIMALAEKQGLSEIVNVCNACYSTLRKAQEKLAQDNDLNEKVNLALAEEGLKYTGNLNIRHLMEVIVNDLNADDIKKHIKKDLSGFVVAPYYGCQLNRPWADIDDAHYPVLMDRLIEMVGAKPLKNYSAKTECCGAAHMVAHKDLCMPLNNRIVKDAVSKSAQTICTLCPLCQFNVDASQYKSGLPMVPVIFFTQMMGLAFGLSEKDLKLQKLLTPFKLAV